MWQRDTKSNEKERIGDVGETDLGEKEGKGQRGEKGAMQYLNEYLWVIMASDSSKSLRSSGSGSSGQLFTI